MKHTTRVRAADRTQQDAIDALIKSTDRVVGIKVEALLADDREMKKILQEEIALRSQRHDLRNSITKKNAARRARIQLAWDFRKAAQKATEELAGVDAKLLDVEQRKKEVRNRAEQTVRNELNKSLINTLKPSDENRMAAAV